MAKGSRSVKGFLNKFRKKEPEQDEVQFTGDFLLAKYSFEEYCQFFAVSGFEAEKAYNAYQDRRSWVISEHEKRGGRVFEVPCYYDEYLEYLESRNLPDNDDSRQSYMFSKVQIDMQKAGEAARAKQLVEEFVEVTRRDRRKTDVAVAQIGQWLEDNWDQIDNDFLVILSQYIRIAAAEGQEETATRLAAYRQMIAAMQSNPAAKHILKAMVAQLSETS